MKRAIYDFFSNEIDSNGDYYNIGTFEQFDEDMQDPQSRKEFYDFFSNEVDENGDYYNLGTFAEFEQDIARSTAKEIGKASAQATGQATKEQPQVARPVTAVQASDRGPFYTTKAFGDWLNGQPNPQMVEQTKAINQAQASGQVTETPTAPSAPKAEDIATTKVTATTAEVPKVETTANPVSALQKADGTPYKAEGLQATADKQQAESTAQVAGQPTVQVESVEEESQVDPTETDQAKLEAKATKTEGDQKVEDGDESWNEYKAKLKDLYGGMNIPEASQVDNSIGIKFTEEAPYNRYAGQYIEYAERMVLQKLREIAIEQNGGQPLSDAQLIAITNQAKSMSEKDVQKVLGAEGLEALRKTKEQMISWEKRDQRNAHAINNLLTDPGIANYLKQFYDGEGLAEVAQNAVVGSGVELGQMNADDAKKYIGARMAKVDYLLGDDAMQYYLRNINNNNEQTKQKKAQAILSTAMAVNDLLYSGLGLPEKAKTYARNALKTAVKNGQIGTTDGDAVVNDVLERVRDFGIIAQELLPEDKEMLLGKLQKFLDGRHKITSLEDVAFGDEYDWDVFMGNAIQILQYRGQIINLGDAKKSAEDKRNQRKTELNAELKGKGKYGPMEEIHRRTEKFQDVELDLYDRTIEYLNDADVLLNDSNATGVSGFISGLQTTLADKDSWTFGLTDLAKANTLRRVIDKYARYEAGEKGVEMTDAELAFLDAFVTYTAAEALTNPSLAYKVGASVGASIPYIIEMALTPSAPGRFLAQTIFKYAKKRGLGKIAKVVAKGVGGATNSVIQASIFAPARMATAVVENDTPKLKATKDESDIVHVDGIEQPDPDEEKKSNIRVASEVFYEQAMGAWVERAGGNIFKFLGKPTRGVSKWLKDRGISIPKNSTWSQILKRVHFNGMAGEFAEEILNQIVMLPVSDQTFDANEKTGIFSTNNIFEVFLTTTVLSSILHAPNAAIYKTEAGKLSDEIDFLEDLLKDAIGDEFDEIKEAIYNATINDMSNIMKEVARDKKRTTKEKKDLLNYISKVATEKELVTRWEGEQMSRDNNAPIKAQEEIENATNEGMNIKTTGDSRESQVREKLTGKYLAETFGTNSTTEAEQALFQRYGTNDVSEIAISVATDAELSKEQKGVIQDYLKAKAMNIAKFSKVQADAQQARRDATQKVDDKTHSDGAIYQAELNNGKTAHIIVGEIEVDNKGDLSINKGEDNIIIVNEDNEKELASPKDVVSIARYNAEDVKNEALSEVDAEWTKNLGVAYGEHSVGDVVTLRTYNGEEQGYTNTNVTIVRESQGADGAIVIECITEDGSVLTLNKEDFYKMADGAIEERIAPTVKKAEVVKPKEQTTQAETTQEQAPTAQATEQAPQVESAEVVEESIEQPMAIEPGVMVSLADGSVGEVVSMPEDGRVIVEHEDGSTNEYNVDDLKVAEKPSAQTPQAPQAPTAPQVESTPAVEQTTESAQQVESTATPTAQVEIPTDEKGNKVYEQAPIDATINDIYNDPELDEEEADAYVQARIDGATKRIEAIDKKKPKMGEDRNAYVAERDAWRAERGAEQASLDYWQGVQAQRAQGRANVPKSSLRTNEPTGATPSANVSSAPSPKMDTPKAEPTAPPMESKPKAEPIKVGTKRNAKGQVIGLIDSPLAQVLNNTSRATFNKLGEAMGVAIRIVPHLEGANAKIEGDRITVALDAEQGPLKALGHELLHRIKSLSPEAYEDFADVIEKIVPSFQARMIATRLAYANAGRKIDMKLLREEVVADLAGDIMVDAELMERFVEKTEGKEWYWQIWDVIKNLIEVVESVFRGQDYRNFVKAKRVLLKAMQTASQKYADTYGVREEEFLANKNESKDFIENSNVDVEDKENFDNFVEEQNKEEDEGRNQEVAENEQQPIHRVGERSSSVLPREQTNDKRGDERVEERYERIDGGSPHSNDIASQTSSEETEIQPRDGRIQRARIEGNTREERVKNAVQSGLFDGQLQAYGLTHTLEDVAPNGVGIYVDHNGEPSLYLASNTEANPSYVAVFKDKSGQWTSKMENSTGSKEFFKGMISDVMNALPEGAELIEHTSVSVDGLRTLANQLKHGFVPTGETYVCELNAADIGGVLGIRDNGDFNSISWRHDEVEQLRDILEPYLAALGMPRESVDTRKNPRPKGKVEITLPVLKKNYPQIIPSHQANGELRVENGESIERYSLKDDFFNDNTSPRDYKQVDSSLKKGETYSIDKVKELFYKYSIDEEQRVLADTKYSLRSNSQEVADIVAKAKADGTYMKAPNGKPTNLTEEQWANVRTKAFKNWFGDWENDPENASKVVDENGEPMVVYHQTNRTIYRNVETGEVWDDLDWREKQEWKERDDWDEYWEEEDFYAFNRKNARTTNEFDGFFFAPEYDEYHEYGERTIEAFLNIRKPASREDYHIDARYNDAGQKERIRLQEEGYDGVIREEDGVVDEYVAFEPNQIKSATDNVGTYSNEDNDIRYSLRSNTPFYSNAEYAVENIKQGKATPEQWLAMIQKNGGLKAGEDKWLGLSDWLNEKGKRKDERGKSVTLTKEEVLEFINQNKIKIEEVGYSQFGEGFIDEATKKLEAELKEVGWDEMENRYPGFGEYFEMYGNELVWSEEKAGIGEYEDFILDNKILTPDAQDNAINETRERYTTEGLENKKEIALVVPSVDPYNAHDEIHFGDAGGGRAVAWVRFGETTDEDGNRVLVIDEIQSKRHQDGREKGYRDADAPNRVEDARKAVAEAEREFADFRNAMQEKYDYNSLVQGSAEERKEGRKAWRGKFTPEEMIKYDQLHDATIDARNALEEARQSQNRVPDAPFDKNWQELAMKRMLRYAAENGYDKVAWTTGAQQAERYGMGRLFNDIEREDNPNLEGRRFVLSGANAETFQVDDNGNITASTISEAEGKSLQEVVGKEMAIKMMNLEDGDLIENEDLRIGGEGMKGFYDKMLPSFMNKYGKKWGVKVGEVTMPELQEGYQTMHSIDVTDAMKESVMEGQPLFSLRSGVVSTENALDAMKDDNPKGWESIKDKLRGTPIWNEVAKDANYTNDDAIAKEALSRLKVGIDDLTQEMADNAKGVFEKAKAVAMADRMRRALNEFDAWVEQQVAELTEGEDVKYSLRDNQGNPIDENGRLIVEEVSSINEITDADFETPSRSVQLPPLPKNVDEAIVANGKPVVIKKNVFEKNAIRHKFSNEQSRNILKGALYNPNLVGQTQPTKRPKHWVAIKLDERSPITIIEVNENKDNIEVVGWFTLDDKNLERLKRQADNEGGELLILSSTDKVDSLSTPINNLSSADKGKKNLGEKQEEEAKYSLRVGGVDLNNIKDTTNGRKVIATTRGGHKQVFKSVYNHAVDLLGADNVDYETAKSGSIYMTVDLPNGHYAEIRFASHTPSIQTDTELEYGAMIHGIKWTYINGAIGAKIDISYNSMTSKDLNSLLDMLNDYAQNGFPEEVVNELKASPYNHSEVEISKGMGIEFDQEGETKYSLRGGGVLHPDSDGTREEYDKRVKTTSKKFEKSAMTFYNFMEAFVDEMRSLDILQRIVEKKYGIKLPSFENALDAENRSSSMALKEFEAFMDGEYDAMMQFVDRWIKRGETTQSINYYMIAKSGLERNREFTVRDAINELLNHEDESKRITKAQAEQMRKNYADERNALLAELKSGNIDYVTFNKLADKLARKYAFGRKIEDYSGLTGITGDENNFRQIAEDMVLEFEAKHGDAVVDFWNAVKDVTKAPLRKSYGSGLLSKSMYDKLTTMFEWYIPMRGFEEETAEDVYSYIGADTGVFNPTVALAKGHTEVSDDPLAIMGNMMQSAILQGNRNAVKQRLLFMARNHPVDVLTESRVWLVLHPDGTWVSSYPELSNDMSADQVAQAIAEHEAKMEKLAKDKKAKISNVNLDIDFKIEKASNKSAHAIDVMLNGNHYVIYVNGNPRVAQAVNGQLKDKGTNWLYKVWQSYARWYTASKTSLDVNFMFPNVGRDIQHSTLMTIMDKGFIQGLKFFFNGFATILPVIKGVSGAQIKDPKMRKYWEEFVKYGGETGYAHLESVDDFKRKNEKRLKRMKGAKKATTIAKGTFKYIGSAFDYANRIAESSTRFNAYVSSRKSGADIYDAIRYAKDITVNFNRKGSSMTPGIFGAMANFYRFWMPFANPIIQGIYQFLKVGRRNKGRFFTICGVQMALGFVIPMVNEILFEAIGGDDEDKYINQPDYARRTNMMFYIGGKYIKIPLPPMFRELYGLGDIAYSTMKGLYSPKEATMETVNQMRSMFSLQGQSSMKGKEFSLMRFILPGHLAWIADIEENTTFTGQPLYKEGDFIDEQTPEYQKVYNGTWRYLVEWSRELNHFLGGTDDKSAEMSSKWMNPAVWQHVISEFGGGPYKFVMDVADLVSPESNDEGEPAEFTWSKVPVAKRFVAEVGDRAETRLLNKQYYDYIDSFDDIEYEEKVYTKKAKMGSMEYAEKLNELILSPEYREYKVKNGYEKAVKDLNKYLNDPGLDKSDRKQVEDAIERFKREVLTEAPKAKNFPADGASEMVKEKLDSIKDVVEDVIGDGNEQTKERNRVIRDAKSNLEPLDMEVWKEEQKDKVK